MENIIDLYVSDIEKTEEFIRLKELSVQINKECALLIVSFKNKEALYLEAKERPNVFDLEKAQKDLVEAKSKLYSNPLVKEYLELEKKLNDQMKKDIDELKMSISSHFKNNLF